MSNLTDIVEKGTLTHKRFPQPPQEQVCANCGTHYCGYYCPNCGQKYNVERLTVASIVNHLVENLIGFTPNLPRTLLDLFYRPGYLVRDYIQKKRRDYSNPFSTVLVLATLFTLLTQFVYKTDLSQATMAFGEKFVEEKPIDMTPDQLQAWEEQMAFQEKTSLMMVDAIYDNYGIFLLCTVLVYVIPMWLAFHSRKGEWLQLNLCECATASAYYVCASLVLSMVFAWMLNDPDGIGMYTLVCYRVGVPLLILMLWQLFPMKIWQFVLRLLLFLVLALLFFVLFCALCSIVMMTTVLVRDPQFLMTN